MTTRPLDVDALLDDPRTKIIVCCGSGGVGKTTTAAALGVRAAERGRDVVVLTVDPARRLAQSMGLSELDNSPRRIDVEGDGELHAMMLDMKRTFDEIVEAHADPDRARQILANPFYQSLSSSLSGTQEYMAMEKLGQLHRSGAWDLIVVDTPPSRNALDFLDAPERMGRFLDGRFMKILAAPAKTGGRFGVKVISAGFGMFTGAINKVLGVQLLRDVQTFVAAFDTMFGGFRERAEKTFRLLQTPGTAFLVVAAPEPDALREASYFVDRLARERMPLAGVVVNRVHEAEDVLSAARAQAAAETLEHRGEHAVTAALLRLHTGRMQLAAREARLRDGFATTHPAVPVTAVAAQAEDVHDLAGLRRVGADLAGPSPAA
ncbi:ArsA-related P-loop ATPase [Actinomadura rayongensis]|uniref:AAA family ATPase n=1 Tax=Actinomadura rayongensis TaxID=1429076 RepID=A0A6I4WGI0_9ACTN|nr:AAA family ATPase [Actinomadura rayongensis]